MTWLSYGSTGLALQGESVIEISGIVCINKNKKLFTGLCASLSLSYCTLKHAETSVIVLLVEFSTHK